MARNTIQRMDVRLYEAVIKGCAEQVQKLVEDNPPSLSTFTPQGDTPFHLAASRGDSQIMDVLISHKPCMLLSKNAKGDTAYHKVAGAGHTKAVRFLLLLPPQLECKCDLEASVHCVDPHSIWLFTNKKNETALHHAAKDGFVEIVEVLLQKVQCIALICNNCGDSPLYTACEEGHLNVAERILQKDPSAAISDSRGDGRTCLHAAINLFNPVNRKYSWLLKRSRAVEWERLALLLISKRPRLVEAADGFGDFPLHVATMYRHSQLVAKLVEANSDVCFRLNKDGMAPIHIAARMGCVAITNCLLGSAPDCLQLLDKDDKNALHFALENGNYSLALKCLLRNDVEADFLINAADSRGNTPLHTFIPLCVPRLTEISYLLKVLRMMIRLSAGNAVNEDGNSALDVYEMEVWNPFPLKLVIAKFLRESTAISKRGKKRNDDNSSRWVEFLKVDRETLSLNAVLLATVSFAAAFTIPGGFDSQTGFPVLLHSFALKLFIISDAIAMCLSMLAVFALKFSPNQLPSLRRRGISETSWLNESKLVAYAIFPTLVSFGAGVYVMVAPHCLWLALIVCCFVSIVLLSFLTMLLVPLQRVLL